MTEAFELFSAVVHGAWMLVVTIALYKLWDRLDKSAAAAPDQQQPAEWEPVELSEAREYELEQQEIRRSLYR
jgi:hypothetical protein